MNTWSEYVRALVGDAPQDEVGAKVGVSGSTISRWRAGKRPGLPAEVASLAQAYGGQVLEAFVAAGYLTYEQAGIRDPLESQIDNAERRVDALREQLDEAQTTLLQLLAQREERRAPEGDDDIGVRYRVGGLTDDLLQTAEDRAPDRMALHAFGRVMSKVEYMLDAWPLPVADDRTSRAAAMLEGVYEAIERGNFEEAAARGAELSGFVQEAHRYHQAEVAEKQARRAERDRAWRDRTATEDDKSGGNA